MDPWQVGEKAVVMVQVGGWGSSAILSLQHHGWAEVWNCTISQAFCDLDKRRHPLHHQGLNQASKIGARSPCTTPRTDDPVEDNTRSAGASTAAQPTSTGRLAAWRITPCRTRWLESRLADPALQRAGALFLMKSEPGMGRHEKGGLRPPVHTTSEKIRRRG